MKFNFYVEKFLNCDKVIVWIVLSLSGIIGFFFFEDIGCKVVIVNFDL